MLIEFFGKKTFYEFSKDQSANKCWKSGKSCQTVSKKLDGLEAKTLTDFSELKDFKLQMVRHCIANQLIRSSNLKKFGFFYERRASAGRKNIRFSRLSRANKIAVKPDNF